MRLPQMAELAQSRSVTDAFGGYNHNLRIGDGEFYDMTNMTSDFFPVLSPRGKRGIYKTGTGNVNGMISKEKLCYVRGTKFYIGETEVSGLTLTNEKKTLVSMGAYVIILPDKKYVNTEKPTDCGDIENKVNTTAASFSLCDREGTVITAGTDIPETVSDGFVYIDTTVTPNVLKKYSAATDTWVTVASTYVKIEASGIGAGFNQYDGVSIEASGDAAGFSGSAVIYAKGDDFIVIPGIVAHAISGVSVKVSRTMPDMDFVIESGNRLWGCRYGNGVNEIYASKLGDFKNFNCFMGISTDSYAASLGSDGPFTGAVTYLGHPIFFKENYIHKVYGNFPSNYQIQTTECRGVKTGSSASVAMVNEILYYHGKNGVCAYDGSLPTEVSEVFGGVNYKNAVGCSHGNKYYVSMEDDAGKTSLFVYDAKKGMWHREDRLSVTCFCSHGNELYFVSEEKKTEIGTMLGSGTKDTEKTKWSVESGIITAEMPDRKYISSLNVRMSLDFGTTVSFFIQYDSIGPFVHIASYTASSLRSFAMPIRPKRCDHFRIRIVGEGDAKIYSVTKTLSQGSDMR